MSCFETITKYLLFHFTKHLYLIGLLAASASYGQQQLIILVAEPIGYERADFHYNVCGDQEGCLAHGYDGIYVTLEVKEVVLGDYPKGRSIVAATDGFVDFGEEGSGKNLHLFLLRGTSSQAIEKSKYVVAEADPLSPEACTVIEIEKYISGEVFISPDVWGYNAEHCYTLEEIRALPGVR